MTNNGEWNEMKRLVLARMDDHAKRIETCAKALENLNTQVAVLCDREERESVLAKSTAMRWGSGIGALVAALISGLVSLVRH